MDTYKAICPFCGSPAYYYPAKLVLEFSKLPKPIREAVTADPKVVSCNCTGEKGGVKHICDYSFPKDFQKL